MIRFSIFIPILMISSYEYVEYVDGTMVAACLSPVDSFWPASFFVGSIVLFFIVPLLILVVLYSVIAKNLMDNPSIIMSHASSGVHRGNVYKYRKQVIFMLGAVVVSFFVCLLPFRALTLWIIVVPSEAIVSIGIERFYILLYFCRIMLYMNSAINPILYNLMSSKFRNGFLQLLGCGKIVRSDSISSGPRKGGGTFHTASTNLSSSQGTSSSQRKSRGDSLGGNSTRRPTVQFQQPPVSGPHVAHRCGSIISIRAGPGAPEKLSSDKPPSLPDPILKIGDIQGKIVEEQQNLEASESINTTNSINNHQIHQQPLPNSNGFHRIKDRVRFNGHHHSHRKNAHVHRHHGNWRGSGQPLTNIITTEEDSTDEKGAVEGGNGFNSSRSPFQQHHHGNDNNRFSLLRAASTTLATATPAAATVVVIVASGSEPNSADPSANRRSSVRHLVLQRSSSAQPIRNRSIDPTSDGGRETFLKTVSNEHMSLEGSTIESV
uniref:Thyrotropin-releasing hormone receptor n=1 Tax=Anopheles atroparvus TaxID=41427 RepID=A0AAG5CUN7_ANOAO